MNLRKFNLGKFVIYTIYFDNNDKIKFYIVNNQSFLGFHIRICATRAPVIERIACLIADFSSTKLKLKTNINIFYLLFPQSLALNIMRPDSLILNGVQLFALLHLIFVRILSNLSIRKKNKNLQKSFVLHKDNDQWWARREGSKLWSCIHLQKFAAQRYSLINRKL